MEPSDGGVTEVEIVEGVEYEKGFSHAEFITNKEKKYAELENALVLINGFKSRFNKTNTTSTRVCYKE